MPFPASHSTGPSSGDVTSTNRSRPPRIGWPGVSVVHSVLIVNGFADNVDVAQAVAKSKAVRHARPVMASAPLPPVRGAIPHTAGRVIWLRYGRHPFRHHPHERVAIGPRK